MPETSRRNPIWKWDEIVLACDLVAENGWRPLDDRDDRVRALSALLQTLPIYPPEERGPTFRNANGVGRKTSDIATAHDDYGGVRTHGSRRDKEVLDAFIERPIEMHQTAERLRAGAESGEFDRLPPYVSPAEDDRAAVEGRLLVRRHLVRERDSGARRRKIKEVQRAGGRLVCEVCGFDYQQAYGLRGAGYIECHHVVPLHVAGPRETRSGDLALLCANCHRMIHRGDPWLALDDLRAVIAAQTTSGA